MFFLTFPLLYDFPITIVNPSFLASSRTHINKVSRKVMGDVSSSQNQTLSYHNEKNGEGDVWSEAEKHALDYIIEMFFVFFEKLRSCCLLFRWGILLGGWAIFFWLFRLLRQRYASGFMLHLYMSASIPVGVLWLFVVGV